MPAGHRRMRRCWPRPNARRNPAAPRRPGACRARASRQPPGPSIRSPVATCGPPRAADSSARRPPRRERRRGAPTPEALAGWVRRIHRRPWRESPSRSRAVQAARIRAHSPDGLARARESRAACQSRVRHRPFTGRSRRAPMIGRKKWSWSAKRHLPVPSRQSHGVPKNAAPAAYNVGTTSARSRYSFRISQDVSAMSVQP